MKRIVLAASLACAAQIAAAHLMVTNTTDQSFEDTAFGIESAILDAKLADQPGQNIVGYRQFPDRAVQQVQDLLDGIIKAALRE